MQKVLVIGSPGAGKSTFARRLRDLSGLPLYYLDMLWHKPDQTNVTPAEFDTALERILLQDRWIIDGNYLRTMERRLQACDTVFFLDLPVDVCLSGVTARIGLPREDMPWIETELNDEFRQWIVDFPKEQLPEILRLLAQYQHSKTVVTFRSHAQADRYLAAFRPSLS